MPVDQETKLWTPNLSAMQRLVYFCDKRYILSSGPRLCGKTISSLHRVVRHLWEVDNARLAIFVKFKTTAMSGVWSRLTSSIMKEWLDADLASENGEFRYSVPPREMGAIRMFYFKIENYWGGQSECQLHGLDYDLDIEDKILSTEYSGFYFVELQNFDSKQIFYMTIQQLRMDGVPFDKHLWISDTNPPEKSIDHFAYDIWFKKRVDPPPEDLDEEGRQDYLDLQKDLALYQFTIDDAVFADPRQIKALKASYRGDEEAWNRFILGKWTRGIGYGDKHFGRHFRPEIHVVGEAGEKNQEKWLTLNPDSTTTELICGWDIGKVNHAWVCGQKRFTDEGKVRWEILDEHVVIAEKVTTREFVDEVVTRRALLIKMIGHDVPWRDWTDTTAFDWEKGGTDDIDSNVIEEASEGGITLLSAYAAKRPGAVRKRVEKLKELLVQQRILISAHCFRTIEMFKELRKSDKATQFMARGQEEKHVFDALSYMLYSEILEDLDEEISQQSHVGSRLIQVPIIDV